MRISFSPAADNWQRAALDQLQGRIIHVFASEDSPYRPGEQFDAELRYPDYDGEDMNQVILREYNRHTGERLSTDRIVTADRIHIY